MLAPPSCVGTGRELGSSRDSWSRGTGQDRIGGNRRNGRTRGRRRNPPMINGGLKAMAVNLIDLLFVFVI